jgi:replicative DNA helicase
MKEVPKNRSAEISCLGSILIDQEAMVVVMPILRPADFFEGRHQDIFTAMLALYNRGESIDQITVSQELHAQKKLGEVDITYLSDLITEVPTSLHAEHYARIVKSHSIRRRLVTAGEQIGALAYDETDPNVCISKADQILLTIQSDMATPHIITPSQLSEIGAVHYGNLRNPQHRVSISTGFEELDYHTGGMFPGDYIILAARAGLGKSQVALQVAEVAGKIAPVLMCPIEMHYKQMMDRLVASRTGVPIRQIRSGGYSDDIFDRIFSQALPSIHESGIYMLALNNDVVDSPAVTSTLIGTMARHMKMSYGLGLIVIDYIGLLDPIAGDEKRQRSEQIRHISRRLKVLANSLEVPLLAVAQINREPERRSDKRPALSDLSESGGLEQDADAVWLLYRDDYYDAETNNKGEAEFWLAKQRQGKANIMLPLSWDNDYSRYNQIGHQPTITRKPQEMPEEFR